MASKVGVGRDCEDKVRRTGYLANKCPLYKENDVILLLALYPFFIVGREITIGDQGSLGTITVADYRLESLQHKSGGRFTFGLLGRLIGSWNAI